MVLTEFWIHLKAWAGYSGDKALRVKEGAYLKESSTNHSWWCEDSLLAPLRDRSRGIWTLWEGIQQLCLPAVSWQRKIWRQDCGSLCDLCLFESWG